MKHSNNYPDNRVAKRQKRCNNIYTFLKENAKVSESDYDSTGVAFFLQQSAKGFDLDEVNDRLNNKINDDIPLGLNRNIIDLYKIIGDENKEIYLGVWTIMSIKKSLEIYKDYCNNGQKNVYDVAFRYLGMGHIQVISCDLNSHLLFKRYDGGSNGYDRENNYNSLIKDGPGTNEQFYFTNWFYNTMKDEEI